MTPLTSDRPAAARSLPLLVPLAPAPTHRLRVTRVGLLGGSFNPAHEGHRHVSAEAMKRLRLDQVWWLVSPQNPLKPKAGMLSLAERMRRAETAARHPRIKVKVLEPASGKGFTVDLLRRLAHWTDHRFVWLIGADNLLQLPRWRQWTSILDLCSVAVVERHPYSYGSMAGPAAVRYRRYRLPDNLAHEVIAEKPPRWTFLRMRPHPASSTAIRRGTQGTTSG